MWGSGEIKAEDTSLNGSSLGTLVKFRFDVRGSLSLYRSYAKSVPSFRP